MEEELKKFKEFKAKYVYEMGDIEVIDDKEYYDGLPLVDEDGRDIGDCEKWINVGYKHKGPGIKMHSIETFFQGIKFKDKELQNWVFSYSGLDSNYIQACSEYKWKETGILYWQGIPIDRMSTDYDDLIDELYISAIQNPLYRNLLKNCDKKIIHTMGEADKSKTTFTRYEFEKQLNCLKDFIRSQEGM